MKDNIFEIVEAHLINIEKYKSEDGALLKAAVYSDVMTMDRKLLRILLSNPTIKETFFEEIDGTLVFDKQKFAWFMNSKEFLPDSYTRYANKIGLTHNDNFISKSNDVVIDFPYKDCVLEGGQTKEDQERNEIMYHEVIASDEIRNMLAPKVFTNAKKYTGEGTLVPCLSISDEDNLIIKGNNLIVLASLLKRYEGKVKCIYIDPPYNPRNASNNTFGYNNTFKRSTWLTFMKNRLDIAKKLLKKDDGVLIIAIDKNEQAYLGVLLKELFTQYDTHLITVVHNPRGVQGKNFSYTHEFLYYVIPKGKALIQNRKIDKEEIEYSPLRNWGSDSLRGDAKNCFYPILIKNEKIIGFGNVTPQDEHPNVNEFKDDIIYVYPIDTRNIERKWRYARNSVESIKHLLKVEKKKNGIYDILLGKDFGQYKTVWINNTLDANGYGKQWLNKLVDDKSFSFPKSIYAVEEAIYSVVANDKEAIVLDFFGGSGTSAEAVSIINKKDSGNRKFIVVEQMDYIESITTERIIKSVFKNGIKHVVYFELLEDGTKLISEIESSTENTIGALKEKIYADNRIVPYITREELKAVDKDFESLSLEDKKKALIALIDKNKLYVNYSDMEDESYDISDADKEFSKSFYKEVF